MIKAVIFDCFGVLVRDAWHPFINKYFDPESEAFVDASTSLRKVAAGLMSYDDFYAEMSVATGIDKGEVKALLTGNTADDELFSYIEETLRPSYKIGMLSNAGSDRTPELFGRERLKLFDDIVLSYQFGTAKPDEEIYEIALSRLGVEASEAVFIDDVEYYCAAAEKVGMKAIEHKDTAQTIRMIRELINA